MALSALFLASCSPGGGSRPLHIGDQRGLLQGLLKASGQLDGTTYPIEWSAFSSGPPLTEAMRVGAVDLGIVGDASLIGSVGAGGGIKAIAADRGAAKIAILIPANSQVRSVADLRGKTIATPRGTPGHLLVLAALQKAGLRPSDVKFAFIAPTDAASALSGGSVDAAAVWTPIMFILLAQPNPPRILVTNDGLTGDAIFLAATDDAISTKRPELRDMVLRIKRAYAWAAGHHKEYADLIAKQSGLAPGVALRVAQNDATITGFDDAFLAQQQRSATLYKDAGLIPKDIEFSKAVDKTFLKAGE